MKSKRRAFTLIEMIVVVGIITILVAILVASLRKPRGLAHQAVCMRNLREITTAAHVYADQHNNSYPSGSWRDMIEDRISKGSGTYRCPADTQQKVVTGDTNPDNILSYGINRWEFAVTAPLDAADYSFWTGVKKFRVKRPSETILFA
ncbi:unnamed protein product, partial [marine sediment metagenome]